MVNTHPAQSMNISLSLKKYRLVLLSACLLKLLSFNIVRHDLGLGTWRELRNCPFHTLQGSAHTLYFSFFLHRQNVPLDCSPHTIYIQSMCPIWNFSTRMKFFLLKHCWLLVTNIMYGSAQFCNFHALLLVMRNYCNCDDLSWAEFCNFSSKLLNWYFGWAQQHW